MTPSSAPSPPLPKSKGQFGPSSKSKDRAVKIYPPLPGQPTLDPYERPSGYSTQFPQVYVPSTGYSESYTQTGDMQEWRMLRELNRTNRRLMKEKQVEARYVEGSTPYSSRSSSRASTPYEPQEPYSETLP